jgi:dihydropteroate synthase
MFDKEDFKTIEEEINRVFRTSTFNLIKKRHYEDEKLKKYPILRETSGKDTIEGIINRMEKRSRIPKVSL